MHSTVEVHLVQQPYVDRNQIEFAHLSETGRRQVAAAVGKMPIFGTFHGSESAVAQETLTLLVKNGISFPHGIMPPLPDLGDHFMVESLRAGDGTVPPFSPKLCSHPNAAKVIRRMRDGLALIAVTLERCVEMRGLAVSHSPLIELLAWSCGFVPEDAQIIAPLGPLEGFIFQLTWADDHFEYRVIKRVNLLAP